MPTYASRAGAKLAHALATFKLSVRAKVCADFGSSTGGFVDCLLQAGAAKVYAVETGYGVLAWTLRTDQRVVVLERTNAMHVCLPEKMDLITIDTSWTKQSAIIPNALANLKPNGQLLTLIKPHYELGKAKLNPVQAEEVARQTLGQIQALGLVNQGFCSSPILGGKAENTEFLALFMLK